LGAKLVGLTDEDKRKRLEKWLRHATSQERIKRIGFRGTKTMWETRDRERIGVKNLDPIHLLSIVGFLWRWAQSQRRYCKSKAALIKYQGELPTEEQFLRAIPTWPALQKEVDRRKLRAQLLPEYQGRAEIEKSHLRGAGGRNNPRGPRSR